MLLASLSVVLFKTEEKTTWKPSEYFKYGPLGVDTFRGEDVSIRGEWGFYSTKELSWVHKPLPQALSKASF